MYIAVGVQGVVVHVTMRVNVNMRMYGVYTGMDAADRSAERNVCSTTVLRGVVAGVRRILRVRALGLIAAMFCRRASSCMSHLHLLPTSIEEPRVRRREWDGTARSKM
eukprot:9469873-Pyramimonas_sp.AAC.1